MMRLMAYDYALSPDKYLSDEEEARLRATLAKYRNSDLRNTTSILLMLVCGLRSGEVRNVTKDVINFNDNTIFINTTKGGRPRIIPLTADLVSRLKELCEKSETDRLFPFSRIRHWYIWEQFRPCQNKGTHACRHTAAKNIYKQKQNFPLAQSFLGHKSISTTAQYLQIQTDAEEMRDAIK